MVCLGNICRSPMAQGALENMVRERSLAVTVDSAGTENWHFNKSPDYRAQNVATGRGWEISAQKARQILSSDFNNFDLISNFSINFLEIRVSSHKTISDFFKVSIAR